MIEARAIIKNIEKTKEKVEELGAEFKSNYLLKDIIFVPKKENYNLSDDYIRIRIHFKSNWPTKRVMVVRKQAEFKEIGKADNIIINEGFDTEDEAFEFVRKNIQGFCKGFEFEREGWQYQLNNNQIYIENIKGWKPTVEIEAESEGELKELFDKIGIVEIVKESLPEIIRKSFIK